MKKKTVFLAVMIVAIMALSLAKPLRGALASEEAKAEEAHGGAHGGGEGGHGGGEGKKKAENDAISGGEFEGDPVYVHLQPMVFPVIREDGAEQIVTLILDVHVKDYDAAEELSANMPRVKDALLRGLYGRLGSGTLQNGKMVDVTKIKRRALLAIREVSPEGSVIDVLILGVAQRMF